MTHTQKHLPWPFPAAMQTCQTEGMGVKSLSGPLTSTRKKLSRLPPVRFTQRSSRDHANASFSLPVVASRLPHSCEVTHAHTENLSVSLMTCPFIKRSSFCSDLGRLTGWMLVTMEMPHALVCTITSLSLSSSLYRDKGNERKQL